MEEKTNQKESNEEIKTKGRLPLTSDYVFKRVFTKDENNSMLKDFLEAILNIKIEKVIVKNPEIPKNLTDERLGILDLKVEVDGNKIIDVEIQMKNEGNIKERSAVYLSKISSRTIKNKTGIYRSKKVIVINILNFNYFKRNEYHSIARMKFDKNGENVFVDMGYKEEDEIATNVMEMQFIEIPKFIKKNPECKTKMEQWLWLISGESEEKIKMAEEKNEEIKKTVEVLDELSMNDEERALYEYREKALLDEISRIAYATNKGKKEGKLQDAKKMLEKNIPIETIIEITELSEEEIEKLKKIN